MEREDNNELRQGLDLADKIGLAGFATAVAILAVLAGYNKSIKGEFFPPLSSSEKVVGGVHDEVIDVVGGSQNVGDWEIKDPDAGDWEVIKQP